MKTQDLKKSLQIVKDFILFDSSWGKRNQIKNTKLLPKEALKRIMVYRELTRNSFNSLMINIYPHTHALLKNPWEKLLSDYVEAYPPNSPILNKVAEHFSEYLSKQKAILKKHSFIKELALYEWLEVEIYEKEDIEKNGNKSKELLLNPIHLIHQFQFPIPEIIEKIKTKKRLDKIKKRPTAILIYRNPKDLRVRFFELSRGSLEYLTLLKKGIKSKQAIEYLIEKYKTNNNHIDLRKNISSLVKVLERNRILV